MPLNKSRLARYNVEWEPAKLSVYSEYCMGYATELESRQGKTFSSPLRPDRLRGSYILLCTMYQEFFLEEYSDWNMKLTTYLHPVPRLIMHGAVLAVFHTSIYCDAYIHY
jgi:hypothetical protein